MAIPFTQSMRSVHSDRGYASLISIAIAIALFIAWVAWFCLAPITRYETGEIVRVTRNDRIVAAFPIQVRENIRQGQVAHIRPQRLLYYGDDIIRQPQDQVGSMSARVAEVIGITSDNILLVEFYVQWNTASLEQFERITSRGGELAGEIEVEVEQITPVTLVARASGIWMDAPTLSFTQRNGP